jgi:hypothetical protein
LKAELEAASAARLQSEQAIASATSQADAQTAESNRRLEAELAAAKEEAATAKREAEATVNKLREIVEKAKKLQGHAKTLEVQKAEAEAALAAREQTVEEARRAEADAQQIVAALQRQVEALQVAQADEVAMLSTKLAAAEESAAKAVASQGSAGDAGSDNPVIEELRLELEKKQSELQTAQAQIKALEEAQQLSVQAGEAQASEQGGGEGEGAERLLALEGRLKDKEAENDKLVGKLKDLVQKFKELQGRARGLQEQLKEKDEAHQRIVEVGHGGFAPGNETAEKLTLCNALHRTWRTVQWSVRGPSRIAPGRWPRQRRDCRRPSKRCSPCNSSTPSFGRLPQQSR